MDQISGSTQVSNFFVPKVHVKKKFLSVLLNNSEKILVFFNCKLLELPSTSEATEGCQFMSFQVVSEAAELELGELIALRERVQVIFFSFLFFFWIFFGVPSRICCCWKT